MQEEASKSRFHCCATCKNFVSQRNDENDMVYLCSRLGYETKPSYQFNCWEPKENIKRLMDQEGLK
ncbi:hypothetical protein [Bacillus horti]|uniref:Uracil-DNA glycosylase n=1 Tax=Caldalkalibacillus horti TaxID=77523 RepID=A0ABT9VXC8_9BACI|nr:hypothetical protein [Bacillus horti]MDQ0165629.1 hypothetical protein [Bacillus horti]